MSLRTLRRFLIASALGASVSVVAGCDDDPSPKDRDAATDGGDGDGDSGGGNPDKDAGMSDEDASTSACEMRCEDNMLSSVRVPGCCIEETGKCGLDVSALQEVDDAIQLEGCYERDRPGAESDHCGDFFDQIDEIINQRFDLVLEEGTLPFAPCCTPQGECGVNLSETTISANGRTVNVNLHLGCIGFRELQEALGTESSIEDPLKLNVLPFCNPTDGSKLTEGSVPGVPAFVCGCGDGVPYTDQAVPCLSNLPPAVCGADAPTDEQLGQFPSIACGCGEGKLWEDGLPCINNVDTQTCGKGDSTEALAQIPEYVCGCGTRTPDGTCLPNTAPNVCGALEITEGPIPGIGKHACGCGDGELGNGQCLPNIPQNVCGAEDPGEDDLAALPDFLCGCGEGVLAGGRPCLNNLSLEVCGTAPVPPSTREELPGRLCGCGENVTYNPAVMTIPCLSKQAPSSCGGGELLTPGEGDEPDCITAVPAYLRGCGDGEATYPPTCIPGAPSDIFGCDQPEAGRVVPNQPSYACGCGIATNGDRCIPNIAPDVCGARDPSNEELAGQPQFFCGCGEDLPAMGRPCLSYLPLETCGTLPVPPGMIDWLPGRLCGCGTGVTYDPSIMPVPCLSGQAMNACGGEDPITEGNPDCITAVPAYMRGCGDTPPTAYPPTCIANIEDTIFGCDQPPAGPVVPTVPSYVCGCGAGVFAAQCIPNVHTDACGAVIPTQGPIPGWPAQVCGCGEDVRGTGTCIPFTKAEFCGAVQPD